jgi:hypothetical protein
MSKAISLGLSNVSFLRKNAKKDAVSPNESFGQSLTQNLQQLFITLKNHHLINHCLHKKQLIVQVQFQKQNDGNSPSYFLQFVGYDS